MILKDLMHRVDPLARLAPEEARLGEFSRAGVVRKKNAVTGLGFSLGYDLWQIVRILPPVIAVNDQGIFGSPRCKILTFRCRRVNFSR